MTCEKTSLGAQITPHRRRRRGEEKEEEHSVIPLTGRNSRKPDGELHALFLSCCHETHAVPPRANVRRLSYSVCSTAARRGGGLAVEVPGFESRRSSRSLEKKGFSTSAWRQAGCLAQERPVRLSGA